MFGDYRFSHYLLTTIFHPSLFSLPAVVDGNGSSVVMQDIDISDADKTDFTVKNLNPHRYYYFYLQGHTAAGYGEITKMKGATLLDGGDIAIATFVLVGFNCFK